MKRKLYKKFCNNTTIELNDHAIYSTTIGSIPGHAML